LSESLAGEVRAATCSEFIGAASVIFACDETRFDASSFVPSWRYDIDQLANGIVGAPAHGHRAASRYTRSNH
jgi:hypothetical protein